MIRILAALAMLTMTLPVNAQYIGEYTANPYAIDRVNPYEYGADLYTRDGEFRGTANNDQYDPNSTSNPYGRYGNPYSPDSINNPYGAGNPYSYDSPTNPYGGGLVVCGDYGCQ